MYLTKYPNSFKLVLVFGFVSVIWVSIHISSIKENYYSPFRSTKEENYNKTVRKQIELPNLFVSKKAVSKITIENNVATSKKMISKITETLPVLRKRPGKEDPPPIKDEFPYDVPDATKLKVDFLHKPANNICDDIGMIALITTSLPNRNLRNMIRTFWSKVNNLPFKVKPVFMLGSPKRNVNEINSKIADEANQYKDILQGSFIDAYWNLTVKMINGMRWRYEDCKKPPFVLFHDDDASVLLLPLQGYIMKHLSNPKNILNCAWDKFTNSVVFRQGKYAVPRSRYSKDIWPDFCSGSCFMMSGDVASKLFETSRKMVINIGLTDVTVTGIVREKSGIEISADNTQTCKHLVTSLDIEERLQQAMDVQLRSIA